MSFACITSHQLYYITSSLHHLDALHHLTSEYSNRVNLMYYTRCHMYYMGFTFTDAKLQYPADLDSCTTPLTQGSQWTTTERSLVCIQRPQPERERTLVSINGERRKRIVDSSVRKSGDSKSAVVGGHLLHRMSARRRGKEHRAQA